MMKQVIAKRTRVALSWYWAVVSVVMILVACQSITDQPRRGASNGGHHPRSYAASHF